jgi:hypothetical protein
MSPHVAAAGQPVRVSFVHASRKSRPATRCSAHRTSMPRFPPGVRLLVPDDSRRASATLPAARRGRPELIGISNVSHWNIRFPDRDVAAYECPARERGGGASAAVGRRGGGGVMPLQMEGSHPKTDVTLSTIFKGDFKKPRVGRDSRGNPVCLGSRLARLWRSGDPPGHVPQHRAAS